MSTQSKTLACTSPLDAGAAVRKVQTGEAIVIDVRENDEVAASGKAENALHIPLATLAEKADPNSPDCFVELKHGKSIAVYCAAGARASIALQALKKMGHADVHNIGGFSDWVNAGGAVTAR